MAKQKSRRSWAKGAESAANRFRDSGHQLVSIEVGPYLVPGRLSKPMKKNGFLSYYLLTACGRSPEK